MIGLPSTATMWAAESMVASVDHLASSAGVEIARAGGNAVDTAIATNAVLTVTQQHMCGLGGDLWAIVHQPGGEIAATLNASGRAGSGADPDAMRAAGHTTIPHRGHVQAAPVPGCVDGWLALHERFGRIDLQTILAPAIRVATDGFAVTPQLAASSARVVDVEGNTDLRNVSAGQLVKRPGVARTLKAILENGRDGFYRGEFGEALHALGAGEYAQDDFAQSNADWVEPLEVSAWGHRILTTPPNSQGYLSLAGAWIAERCDLPNDVNDPLFAHLLIESARAAAFDRPQALHEHADGQALVSPEVLAPRQARIDPARAVDWGDHHEAGDTIYLCTSDGDGMAVSLIQSNAAGFGSHLCVGDTGIFLHNRGLGFNLTPGHPAEYGPGRRPPHTLSPAMVLNSDDSLRAVLGTMGGDAQPQVVLQMLARMLVVGERPGAILSAGRFTLASPTPQTGFDTWSAGGEVLVQLEPHAEHWADGLRSRGHQVEVVPRGDLSGFGHAHIIERDGDGWRGAADPRARASAALGR